LKDDHARALHFEMNLIDAEFLAPAPQRHGIDAKDRGRLLNRSR
jgi:hypothetical protein